MKQKKFDAILDRIINIMAAIAGIMLAFMLLSITADVCSRFFFGYSIFWVDEISAYLLLYITFLVAAWVLKAEGHVSMDIIILHLKRRAQAMANLLTSLVSCVVCFIITWYGIKVTLDLYSTNYFTPTVLHAPKFIIIAIIFIGSFLLAVQFFRRSLGFLNMWKALASMKKEFADKFIEPW